MINSKNLSLLACVFQQSALILVIRYSKTRPQDATPYLSSVVVFSAELYKMILSASLEFITNRSAVESKSLQPEPSQSEPLVQKSLKVLTKTIKSQSKSSKSKPPESESPKANDNSLLHLFDLCNKESLKIVFPAILYVIQNNLMFYALSNLSVPTYQITNQVKLLTTAIISRIMLKTVITNMQYFAILLLGLGVAVVHISEHQENFGGSGASTNLSEEEDNERQNQWLGLVAVSISCVTSGLAGVYFELVLKNTQQSVHRRNFQLAFYSLLLASFHILSTDYNKITKDGIFQGFDMLVILIVVMQGMIGFIVSMVLKYANAVLKGFAISIAVVVATVASFFLFDTSLNAMFVLGAGMVGSAVKMYSHYGVEANNSRVDKATINDSKFGWKQIVSRIWIFRLVLTLTVIATVLFQNKYWNAFKQEEDVGLAPTIQVATSVVQACTPENRHDLPHGVDVQKYNLFGEGMAIADFIVTELHKVNAPVTLLWGSALHEFRNGTGNCVQPNFEDDDIDLGVFKEHFHYVVSLKDEIEEKFSWKLYTSVGHGTSFKKTKDMLYIMPHGQKLKGGFQVDVYSFQPNHPTKGFVNFHWDKKIVALNALLPLVKHKPVVTSNSTVATTGKHSIPFYYMPFDNACYLANLYGSDFMTPKKKFKGPNSRNRFDRFDNPRCDRELSLHEMHELEQQLSFSNISYLIREEDLL